MNAENIVGQMYTDKSDISTQVSAFVTHLAERVLIKESMEVELNESFSNIYY